MAKNKTDTSDPKTPPVDPTVEPATVKPETKPAVTVSAVVVITRVAGHGLVTAQSIAKAIGPETCKKIETLYAGSTRDRGDQIRRLLSPPKSGVTKPTNNKDGQ
ncbi:MAG: hypothetical protein WBD31_13665 [Rubripirellula sp.]